MKFNCLIVEDEEAIRLLLKKFLFKSDLDINDIYEAKNGKEGIEVLKNHKINLMFVDIYMPIMDGMEMLDYVRDHPEFKNIPAIVVSVENDEKRIEAIVRKGLGFIHKPFTYKLINQEIKKFGGFS